MPMASQALESVSVIPMASPTGSALASELEPRLDSGRKSESPMVSASDSGLEPESLAWASESVPGLEPEMLTGSDSVMPVLLARESASVWVPVPESDSDLVLASVMPMASQASDSAWVPESVWARESASELGEDRNQRHLQPLSLPLLRLLPRIYPGK